MLISLMLHPLWMFVSLVPCHWSFVLGPLSLASRFKTGVRRRHRTNGAQVSVQPWPEFVQDGLDGLYGLIREQPPRRTFTTLEGPEHTHKERRTKDQGQRTVF